MALECACSAQMRGGGGVHAGGEKLFVDVREKLFWPAIYCANPRPNARSQSGSRSYRGLGSQALRIICEYDLVTVIVI